MSLWSVCTSLFYFRKYNCIYVDIIIVWCPNKIVIKKHVHIDRKRKWNIFLSFYTFNEKSLEHVACRGLTGTGSTQCAGNILGINVHARARGNTSCLHLVRSSCSRSLLWEIIFKHTKTSPWRWWTYPWANGMASRLPHAPGNSCAQTWDSKTTVCEIYRLLHENMWHCKAHLFDVEKHHINYIFTGNWLWRAPHLCTGGGTLAVFWTGQRPHGTCWHRRGRQPYRHAHRSGCSELSRTSRRHGRIGHAGGERLRGNTLNCRFKCLEYHSPKWPFTSHIHLATQHVAVNPNSTQQCTTLQNTTHAFHATCFTATMVVTALCSGGLPSTGGSTGVAMTVRVHLISACVTRCATIGPENK